MLMDTNLSKNFPYIQSDFNLDIYALDFITTNTIYVLEKISNLEDLGETLSVIEAEFVSAVIELVEFMAIQDIAGEVIERLYHKQVNYSDLHDLLYTQELNFSVTKEVIELYRGNVELLQIVKRYPKWVSIPVEPIFRKIDNTQSSLFIKNLWYIETVLFLKE